MGNALEVIETPAILPKGVTKRQWRLAALLPRCETAAEAMRQAGYGPQTIDKNSRHQLGTVGTRRAIEVQANVQRDRARGYFGVSERALRNAGADLDRLDPRDRLAVGAKYAELALQAGESVESTGDGDSWKQRVRRACRLMARLTEARLRAIPPPH
jgi:hypothetical protein